MNSAYFMVCLYCFQMAGNFPDRLDPALPDFVVDPLVFTLLLESLRPNGACFFGPLLASTSILPVFKKVSMPLAWLLRRLEELDLLEELFLREDPLASGGCSGTGLASATASEDFTDSDTPFSRGTSVELFSLAGGFSVCSSLSWTASFGGTSSSATLSLLFSMPSEFTSSFSSISVVSINGSERLTKV